MLRDENAHFCQRIAEGKKANFCKKLTEKNKISSKDLRKNIELIQRTLISTKNHRKNSKNIERLQKKVNFVKELQKIMHNSISLRYNLSENLL